MPLSTAREYRDMRIPILAKCDLDVAMVEYAVALTVISIIGCWAVPSVADVAINAPATYASATAVTAGKTSFAPAR